MNVTINQVAQEANLSVATVSRVLNTKGQVCEETRRRVLEVAERIRHAPNIAARSLITSQLNLPNTLPTVVLNCIFNKSPFDSINIDNYGGPMAMLKHFINLGHSRIESLND